MSKNVHGFFWYKCIAPSATPRKLKTQHWVVVGSSQKFISFQICHGVSLKKGLNSGFTYQTTHTQTVSKNVHGFFTKKCIAPSATWENWWLNIEWWWVLNKNPFVSRFVTAFLTKRVSIVRLHVRQHTHKEWEKTYMAFLIKVHRPIGNPRKLKTQHWVVVGSQQKSICVQIYHSVSHKTGFNSAFTCQTTHTQRMSKNVGYISRCQSVSYGQPHLIIHLQTRSSSLTRSNMQATTSWTSVCNVWG